jgi:hypothetical protein
MSTKGSCGEPCILTETARDGYGAAAEMAPGRDEKQDE